MAIPDDKLARLEAVRDKLTTSEAKWLDTISAAWSNEPAEGGRPITWGEWNRVEALAAEAEARP